MVAASRAAAGRPSKVGHVPECHRRRRRAHRCSYFTAGSRRVALRRVRGVPHQAFLFGHTTWPRSVCTRATFEPRAARHHVTHVPSSLAAALLAAGQAYNQARRARSFPAAPRPLPGAGVLRRDRALRSARPSTATQPRRPESRRRVPIVPVCGRPPTASRRGPVRGVRAGRVGTRAAPPWRCPLLGAGVDVLSSPGIRTWTFRITRTRPPWWRPRTAVTPFAKKRTLANCHIGAVHRD
jgi:hypothetical protein